MDYCRRCLTVFCPSGVLLSLLLSASVCGADALEFGLNLKPGNAIVQNVEIDRTVELTRRNNTSSYRQIYGLTLRTEVLDRASDSGGVWTKMTYERLRFEQTEGHEGPSEYDSAALSSELPENLPREVFPFVGLLDQSLLVEYDVEGQVAQIEGEEKALKKMVDALLKGKAQYVPRNEEDAAARNKSYFYQWMKSIVSISLPVYPSRPTGLGESWTNKRPFGSDEQDTLVSTYTLKDYDDDRITLGFAGSIAAAGDDTEPFELPNGIKIVSENSGGTRTGQSVVDRETGWTRSSKTIQKMSSKDTFTRPNGNSHQQSVTATTTTTVTTETLWHASG